ncbi:MAG: hypothetical protein CR986_02300 [Ignavibacteriae bacterium]|nr:MAG: hypothetical protein CR986_02300 [Ignavibacteriota bacterium]
MHPYLEHSFSAYKIVTEVSKSMKIDEAPAASVVNGNAQKIINKCVQIIEENYEGKKIKELLKYYIAHSFFEDYDLENYESYDDDYIN